MVRMAAGIWRSRDLSRNPLLVTPMFDTEIESGPSLPAYALQQLAAPSIPTLLTLVASAAVESVTRQLGYGIHYYVVPALDRGLLAVTLVVGYGFAMLVRRLVPSAAATGRWVWVLPATIFLLAALRQLAADPKILGSLIWPASGEAAWGYLLLTCPTGAAIFYAIAMRRTRVGLRGVRPSPRA